jgi:integrase
VACEGNVEYWSLLAITRYDGLRISSEIRDLKFSDFERYDNGMIFIVPDTGKTGTRRVPVFSEFLPYFEELQRHRKEGQEYLFEHCRKVENVGTAIKKRMVKAGLPVWKKFFVTLRSSCITDKERLGFSRSLMDSIFGNSERIRL